MSEFMRSAYARRLFEHQIPEFINQMKNIAERMTELSNRVEILSDKLEDLILSRS